MRTRAGTDMITGSLAKTDPLLAVGTDLDGVVRGIVTGLVPNVEDQAAAGAFHSNATRHEKHHNMAEMLLLFQHRHNTV